MNWIIFLKRQEIPYHIYKLNQGDSIILKKNTAKNFDTIIILTGIMSLAKIFYNKELLPLAILNKNDIVNQNSINKTNYKITALKSSYIIKLKEKSLYNKKIEKQCQHNIIQYYQKTIKKYEETISIINQKNQTKRIILFILLIFWKFGNIRKSKITISFKLTKKCIATMTSTGINTVNKIIKKIHTNEKKTIKFLQIKKLKLV